MAEIIIWALLALLAGIIAGGIGVYLSIRDAWITDIVTYDAEIKRRDAEINALRAELKKKETPRCYEITDAQISAFLRGESIENNYFDEF